MLTGLGVGGVVVSGESHSLLPGGSVLVFLIPLFVGGSSTEARRMAFDGERPRAASQSRGCLCDCRSSLCI